MHASILETRFATWPDEAACAAAAQRLAVEPATLHATVELAGPLGAGKTTFVRHLLRAFGVRGRIKSPSYAVVEPYELPAGRGAAWHFDFYRFERGSEWEDAGFRDLFAQPGLKLVEWAEHARDLPRCDLRIELSTRQDEGRDVRWAAFSERGLALIDAVSTAGAER
ncbi:MAG TPA: tRNA (adenosine(37)-N6)-threonylcarbamoyltransferase complex ATPase subunit type 1 TsaE [Methylibium sp.]|uniref:tRNA (adenosine(37)-N6)-threonylcarbamoyltransferase complex ATPase subunit type 1 TsaE n=1 Tax=Methylibium sp. TaxID=2067992 RepID=UPI002DB57A55|nr:tRNA (adenosine(37)-N6)-threonylcarbamoyltransferase complex ATPase subunit type 1 TsaE [Methylibium sp.]HEU4460259.1 tRNA (adenosine(37)-N6)-threonylcarbamoyltransferase complex ATPase subunit type 1 TsaE [Methylibium sp.]